LALSTIILVATLNLQLFSGTLVQAGDNNNPISNGFVSASNGLFVGSSDHAIWFGDIDNDTFLDVATAGYSGVNVWTGDGAGNWVSASAGLPSNAYDGGICLGDINNDGDLDIAASNYDFGFGGVSVWTGNGAGSWAPAAVGLPSTGWFTGIHLADINDDKNLDLAVGNENTGVKVFTGNGAGVWTDASTNLPNSITIYSVWMDDVNHDNNIDLVGVGTGVHVWLGDGTGVWTEASNGLPWTDQWNGVTLGDINLDGHLDIAATMDMSGHGLKAWLGDGTSNWTEISNGLPTVGLYYGVVLADMVGDKYPDMLVGGYAYLGGGIGIEIWEGNGGSLWVNRSAGLPTGEVIGVAAGDMNNDGYMDIAAAGEGFGVQVWKNDAITPPLIVEVLAPIGWEQYIVGTQEQIRWMVVGGVPPYTMRIEYSTEGIVGNYTIISDGEPDDGIYLWDVPDTQSFDCYVRINVTDSASSKNWDKSDLSFSILETIPPVISNLRPLTGSVIGNTYPVISADYNDSSGIDIGSVILVFDWVNETSSATITSSNVTYVPPVALGDTYHEVSLDVRDSSVNQNLAKATWWFSVDTEAPVMSGELPVNQSTTSDVTPVIRVAYEDAFGINLSTLVLEVDSLDITSSATVTFDYLSYVPTVPLLDGPHNVSVRLADNSTPENVGTFTWWFIVDTSIPDPLPPNITNLQPANESVIENSIPTIGASYDDISGIETSSVVLIIDAVDVTSSATVTPVDVSYTPAMPLTQGTHDVYLSVQDDSGNANVAVATWWFEVNTLPPNITNIQPANWTLTNDDTPTISASYSDDSGIDTASVELKLDSIDVTSLATVTSSSISYTPAALLDGQHTLSLEVGDVSGDPKTSKVVWWFTVDTLPPTITNITPTDGAITGKNDTTIAADYYDESGIDLFVITFNFENQDTGGAVVGTLDISPTGIQFTPDIILPDGSYCAYLEVSDIAGNRATQDWWCFTIDTTPPVVANLLPANQTVIATSTPVISATFHDAAGVNASSVVLTLDSIDVTGSATVSSSGVSFTLASGLSDSVHTVSVYVADISEPSNDATVTWSFTISTQMTDTDNDGLPDDWEIDHFGDLRQNPSNDTDGDSLTNIQEYNLETDPTNTDTDGDGLLDGEDPNPLVPKDGTAAGLDPFFYVILAIIAIVIVLVLLWFFVLRRKREEIPEELDMEETGSDENEES
jgi:hypothetical protein